MKAAVTLAIYLAIGITGAAYGQQPPCCSSIAVMKPISKPIERYDDGGPWPGQPGYKEPPYQSPPALAPVPVPPPPLERVVMTYGKGGRIGEHRLLFEAYFRPGPRWSFAARATRRVR